MPTTPQHSYTVSDESVCVRVELPLVNKAGEVDLNISPERLHLIVGDVELDMALPHKVKDEEAAAKFDKKAHVLTLTMPRASKSSAPTPMTPPTAPPPAPAPAPALAPAPAKPAAPELNVGDRVIVRAPLESSCKYEGRVAFVYSLHGTECRLLLDDPIRGVITGMVSQTVCVTIKKAVPQPEPGRWRLENAYLVARLSPVSSEWQIGMRVQVSMGEYAGQTGSILSVHPQSVTLRMDTTGQVTGYLRKGAVQAVRAGLTDQFAAAAA